MGSLENFIFKTTSILNKEARVLGFGLGMSDEVFVLATFFDSNGLQVNCVPVQVINDFQFEFESRDDFCRAVREKIEAECEYFIGELVQNRDTGFEGTVVAALIEYSPSSRIDATPRGKITTDYTHSYQFRRKDGIRFLMGTVELYGER